MAPITTLPPRAGAGLADGASFTSLLERLIARTSEDSGEHLTLGWLADELGETSGPGFLLALALPALFLPPVAAAALGAPMLLVSLRMATGRGGPLPAFVGRIGLDARRVTSLLRRLLKPVAWLEWASRPRAGYLLNRLHVRAVAIGCGGLCGVLLTPIPVAHSAAALGLVAFAAGLLRHDGIALLCGWALALTSCALMVLIVAAAFAGARLL